MKKAKEVLQNSDQQSNGVRPSIDIVVLDGANIRKYSAVPSIDTQEGSQIMNNNTDSKKYVKFGATEWHYSKQRWTLDCVCKWIYWKRVNW